MNEIIKNINNRKVNIGIIGLGYVGLPLAIRFSEEEFQVIGFDIDATKVKMLNAGKSFIKHISEKKISIMVKTGFLATKDYSKILDVDIMLICVPTPLGDNNEPDLSYVINTLKSIMPYLKEKQLLVLESTTYPGTTEEEIVPPIEDAGYEIGKNYFVGYSPEREDPGKKDYTTKTIPKVVSGYTNNCLKITKALYDTVIDTTVPVSSLRVAEMTKILENIHRAVNIGLVNELKIVADKMGIDLFEVIDAAATKPFGFTAYYPGPGLGGHCIPIDPFYLTWKAKQYNVETRLIELAGEINTNMPKWVIEKADIGLRGQGKKMSGSKVLILGMAYKKNVDDLRESPSFELIRLLIEKGSLVDYHDFYIPQLHKTRKYDFNFQSVKLGTINTYDLVILATDHDKYDFDLLQNNAKLIVDTRGKLNHNLANVISA